MDETDCRKLGLVEEGGYELARAGHVKAVVCKRVRKKEKKMPKNALPLHSSSRTHNITHKTKQQLMKYCQERRWRPQSNRKQKPKSKSNKSA